MVLVIGTVSETAMLVSTRSSGWLALAGIAQRPDELVVDLQAVGADHESPLALPSDSAGSGSTRKPVPSTVTSTSSGRNPT